MSSLPTALQLAQHLCLSLNTYSRDKRTNFEHTGVNACGDHPDTCCHCWAAAHVLMRVVSGVADKVREESKPEPIPDPWRLPRAEPIWHTYASDRTST